MRNIFKKFFSVDKISLISTFLEKKNPTILEIGVHKGQFSKLLFENFKPKKLVLVDPWKAFKQPIYQNSWYGNKDKSAQIKQNQYYNNLNKLFKIEISKKNIILKRQTSDHFFKKNKMKFDLIYIDGNHLKNYVKRDIKNSLKFLNKDGLIVLDDYAMTGWWKDGVTKAVKYMKKKGLVKILAKHSFLSYHHQCIIRPSNLNLNDD